MRGSDRSWCVVVMYSECVGFAESGVLIECCIGLIAYLLPKRETSRLGSRATQSIDVCYRSISFKRFFFGISEHLDYKTLALMFTGVIHLILSAFPCV